MSDPLAGLPARDRKGSRARCLLLTHGADADVAHRLTALTDGRAVVEPGRHVWTPRGRAGPAEAQLGRTVPYLTEHCRQALTGWWLATYQHTARTPTWDVVSQATIAGREGLLLVEAKAHAGELRAEERRKPLAQVASPDSLTNHQRIGACIDEANAGLRLATRAPWLLSRDVRYQMSNRFAWAWKLTELEVPVILVYLGFLNAEEMPEPRFPDHAAWKWAVLAHCSPILPASVWGSTLHVGGVTLTPLIRSHDLPLPSAVRISAA